MFFSKQAFIGAPAAAARKQERTTGSFLCFLPPKGEQACSLYGVRVGMCPGVGPEVWFRCFACCLADIVCRGHAQYTAFAPNGVLLYSPTFWSLCIFWVRNLPRLHCTCTQSFLVPCRLFMFYCSRRGMTKGKHCRTAARVKLGNDPASLLTSLFP